MKTLLFTIFDYDVSTTEYIHYGIYVLEYDVTVCWPWLPVALDTLDYTTERPKVTFDMAVIGCLVA